MIVQLFNPTKLVSLLQITHWLPLKYNNEKIVYFSTNVQKWKHLQRKCSTSYLLFKNSQPFKLSLWRIHTKPSFMCACICKYIFIFPLTPYDRIWLAERGKFLPPSVRKLRQRHETWRVDVLLLCILRVVRICTKRRRLFCYFDLEIFFVLFHLLLKSIIKISRGRALWRIHGKKSRYSFVLLCGKLFNRSAATLINLLWL